MLIIFENTNTYTCSWRDLMIYKLLCEAFIIWWWLHFSDCNGTRTYNHLVRKGTLSHLANLTKWLGCVVSTYSVQCISLYDNIICYYWVLVYELSGCVFESRCSHLNFRYWACFEHGFPWYSGKYRMWIHSEMRTWHDNNIKPLPSKHLSWWRRIEDVFRLRLQKTFSRRLQDVLSRGKYSSNSYVFTRRLQDGFKTSWSRPRRLQDIFKNYSRCFEYIFKTSSRRFAKISSRRFQDVSWSYFTFFVNTFWKCLWDIFKTFLRCTAKKVIHRRICLDYTCEKFRVSVQNLQESQKFLKF